MDQSKLERYWRLLLSLEDDLSLIARYVDPVAKNFGTTSVEISKLNSMACGGIEFFAKAMYSEVTEKRSSSTNIDTWCSAILADGRFSPISCKSVEIESFDLTRTPWDGWTVGNSPGFWKSYNADKHDGFGTAAFIDAIDSTCALFVMYMTYYGSSPRNPRMPSPRTRLIGTGSFPALATKGDALAAALMLGGM